MALCTNRTAMRYSFACGRGCHFREIHQGQFSAAISSLCESRTRKVTNVSTTLGNKPTLVAVSLRSIAFTCQNAIFLARGTQTETCLLAAPQAQRVHIRKNARACAPQRGHVITCATCCFNTCTATSTLSADGSGHELRSAVVT